MVMACISGPSSGSTSGLKSSSSEEDLQQIMDQKRRKRKLSNRESARRSRIRKQKRLDDLTAQRNQIRNENSEIVRGMNVKTQLYLNIEAENSILRAQMAELNQRLNSLNEIINYVKFSRCTVFEADHNHLNSYATSDHQIIIDDCFMNPWSSFHVNHQPIMDMVMY